MSMIHSSHPLHRVFQHKNLHHCLLFGYLKNEVPLNTIEMSPPNPTQPLPITATENSCRKVPKVRLINFPVMHEESIKVEVKRCNRTLWNMGTVGIE